MFRKIASIVAAYAVYVILALAFFKVSGRNPHGDTTVQFKAITAVFGIFSCLISGLLVPVIANSKNLLLNYILAGIIAAFALFSFLKAGGSHWTQVMAIVLFAPASVAGGFWFLRARKNRTV